MKIRDLFFCVALATGLSNASAAGNLAVDAIDTDVYGTADSFTGSGIVDGDWTFALDAPSDGSFWQLAVFVLDFSAPFTDAVTASIGSAEASVTHSAGSGVYLLNFEDRFGPGPLTLNLSGFAGSGAVAIDATAVPEPTTSALMLAALGVVGFLGRRRGLASPRFPM